MLDLSWNDGLGGEGVMRWWGEMSRMAVVSTILSFCGQALKLRRAHRPALLDPFLPRDASDNFIFILEEVSCVVFQTGSFRRTQTP